MAQEGFKHLTEESFQEQISRGVTLVDFFADWCGPCRAMTPILEKLAREVSGRATIAKLDVDSAQKTAASFQVTSIPTLILFKDGKEVGRLVGLRDERAIKDFISTAN